jgi:Uncharacterized alpha/beta hydrolase domain (DUF2235)
MSESTKPATTDKRLIVLCDGKSKDWCNITNIKETLGTWQNATSGEASSYPTNVTRFSRALSQFGTKDGKPVPQILYYQPGVGTGTGDKYTGGMSSQSIFHGRISGV